MNRTTSPTAWIIGLALGYFSLNALLLGLVSPTAEWDHAEQLILSQVWQLGYNSQPPLYTWLVQGLFWVTGPSLSALLALKAALLTLFVAGVALSARELGLTREQQWIAVLGLSLIPQMVWEDQRNYTHTVLALALAAWTLYQFLRLRRTDGWMSYALWGLLLGLGTMSKYNFGLFAVALVQGAVTVASYRRLLFTPRLLIAAAVAAVVFLPHLIWVLQNVEPASEGFHKLEMTRGIGWATLFDLAGGLLASLGVLLLVSPLLIRRLPSGSRQPDPACTLLARVALAGVLVAALMILASGARDIKEHWLQPLIFFVPLLLACHAAPGPRALRLFRGLVLVVLLGVSIALPGQALFADPERPSRLNKPYRTLAVQIQAQIGGEIDAEGVGRTPALILADSDPLAGNLRLAFPRAIVMSQRSLFPELLPARDWLIVAETPLDAGSAFRVWLGDRLGIETLTPAVARARYYHIDAGELELHWAWLGQGR
ncbi:glycosyltransferase family 39 protein [Thiohalocapsa marina]|uniref:Glycosyltransferase family 39 protein n=1 Tax=Thiohalocapsa marina TaxID=424902 RepID=A0A5M8FNC4_9GAMM|nr:glycosyltransferase family 39 protein [Thiohalocapsa marina]KAA6184641.1 glycosyltransferase family 39 protein [Thiohalocapsa marina]